MLNEEQRSGHDEAAMTARRAVAVDDDALVEEAVQIAIDGGFAVNGEHGVAAARVAARHVWQSLLASVRVKDEALREAEDALRDHACHGGPDVPCIRSAFECSQECGKQAGDALITVLAALSDQQGGE